MYTLTLTYSERQAIDWIGGRYRHGDELANLLSELTNDEWHGPEDIVFSVPEHVAWTISEIIDEGLDCFAPELQHKLYKFQGSIV